MAFKAKLIESPEYYKFRRRLLLLNLIGVLPIPFISNYIGKNNLYIILVAFWIIMNGAALIYMRKYTKNMQSLTGNRHLVIDGEHFKINDNKGKSLEEIDLKDVDAIYINEEYAFPQESVKSILKTNENDESEKNYIVLEKDGKTLGRYDFEVDSHYMIVQLNKQIDAWKNNGLTVKYNHV